MTRSTEIDLRISRMADGLTGSEIIKLAGEVKAMIAEGREIYNLTIGDFDPKIFPLPEAYEEEIVRAIREKETNYPAANGVAELRGAVSELLERTLDLRYGPDEILVSGGARPLIYAAYRAIVDPGDTVVFPVPSWNNNYYVHLVGARPVEVEATPENAFMPTADDLRPHLGDATLIALCSPQNPTGTVFDRAQLEAICDLVLEENRRRAGAKPVYVLFDQVYGLLTYGDTKHFDPVSLRPEMRDYTIYVDGVSKSFAATGIRVGWSFGPSDVTAKMRSILSHVGAWAPRAEQIATARFLRRAEDVDRFLENFRERLHRRLLGFHEGFSALASSGLSVHSIEPQAALYLTVEIDAAGVEDVTRFLLEEAGLALVPFCAFGASRDSTWYRLSVGTARKEDVEGVFAKLRPALERLA